MAYRYKTVEIAPEVVREKKTPGAAAAHLERVLNEHAVGGWEFCSLESFVVTDAPGCLGGLLGQRAESVTVYVAVFRQG